MGFVNKVREILLSQAWRRCWSLKAGTLERYAYTHFWLMQALNIPDVTVSVQELAWDKTSFARIWVCRRFLSWAFLHKKLIAPETLAHTFPPETVLCFCHHSIILLWQEKKSKKRIYDWEKRYTLCFFWSNQSLLTFMRIHKVETSWLKLILWSNL